MVKTVSVGVMSRAWAILRTTYGYPRKSFKSIGRPCFAWALRQAWAEAKLAAMLAALPTDTLERSITALREEEAGLTYRGWGTNVAQERLRIDRAMKPLIAELERRAPASPASPAAIAIAA